MIDIVTVYRCPDCGDDVMGYGWDKENECCWPCANVRETQKEIDERDAKIASLEAELAEARQYDALQEKIRFQNDELIEKQKYILQLERSIPVPGQSAHPMTDETYKTIFTILTDYRSKVDTNSMWALFHPEKSAATCERIDAALAELRQQYEVVPDGTKIEGELNEELEIAGDGTLLIATNPGTGMVFQLHPGWQLIRPKENK